MTSFNSFDRPSDIFFTTQWKGSLTFQGHFSTCSLAQVSKILCKFYFLTDLDVCRSLFPCCFDSATALLMWMNNRLTCLVQSKPVKLTVVLLLMKYVSILCLYYLLIRPTSVTEFGDISPLWQLNEDLISIWQTFEPTIENSVCFWAKLRCCKWPNIEQTC